MSRSQGYSAAGRIVWMENSNDSIRNRTRDHPACSAVSQPSALPRAPCSIYVFLLDFHHISRLITTAKACHLTGIPLLLRVFPCEVAPLSTPLFSAHKGYLNLGKTVAWSLIMICDCGPLVIHFIFSPSGRSLDSNCWFSNLTLRRFVSSLSEAKTSYLTSSRRIQTVSITAEGFPTISRHVYNRLFMTITNKCQITLTGLGENV